MKETKINTYIDNLVILVTARGRVQSLAARGAREAALVPRLEGGLDLLSKVDSFLALGTDVAASPPWLGASCRRRRGRSSRSSRRRVISDMILIT